MLDVCEFLPKLPRVDTHGAALRQPVSQVLAQANGNQAQEEHIDKGLLQLSCASSSGIRFLIDVAIGHEQEKIHEQLP